jgi:hypothetical protein
VWEIIFFAVKTHNRAFLGIFPPNEKNNLLHFQNQRYIGIFMPLYKERGREGERGGKGEMEREKERE